MYHEVGRSTRPQGIRILDFLFSDCPRHSLPFKFLKYSIHLTWLWKLFDSLPKRWRTRRATSIYWPEVLLTSEEERAGGGGRPSRRGQSFESTKRRYETVRIHVFLFCNVSIAVSGTPRFELKLVFNDVIFRRKEKNNNEACDFPMLRSIQSDFQSNKRKILTWFLGGFSSDIERGKVRARRFWTLIRSLL